MSEFVPPPFALYRLATAFYGSQAVYVVARLGIADHLADGPLSAADLAQRTETHGPSLRRVLRLAAAHGVLEETEDGRFTLTGVGAALKTGPGSSRSSVQLFAGPSQWKLWGDLLESVRTGEPAFRRVHGLSAFEYFERHADEAAIFDDAMMSFTRIIADAVAATYDFSDLRRIIDVGGGSGALLAGLLQAHAHLTGAVFDRPRMAPAATRTLETAGLSDRAGFVGGDFFEEIPAGYDAYLLKHVIHDWNDGDAARILSKVRDAVGDTDARVLIVEGIYPPRTDASPESRGAAGNDCNMLVATGGRQRSEAEFRALFAASGLSLARIVPTGMIQVIEGRPD